MTWGQLSSATATSEVKQGGNHTAFDVRLSGLIPNGVYSLFYRTFNPDSNNAICPNVEPTVALTARHPDRQQPDADSFVADSAGNAEFDGVVAGRLLDAQQLQVAVIYHFDGRSVRAGRQRRRGQRPRRPRRAVPIELRHRRHAPARDHPEVRLTRLERRALDAILPRGTSRSPRCGHRPTSAGPRHWWRITDVGPFDHRIWWVVSAGRCNTMVLCRSDWRRL